MYNVHFNSSKKFEFVKFVKLHEIMIFFSEKNRIDKKRITWEYFSYLFENINWKQSTIKLKG